MKMTPARGTTPSIPKTWFLVYDTGVTNNSSIDGTNWRLQTFTLSAARSVEKIRVAVWLNSGGTSQATVRVREWDGSDPGTTLASKAAVPGSSSPSGQPYDDGSWLEVTLDAPLQLGTGTYALEVVRSSGSDAMSWTNDISGASYAGGSMYSTGDGGSSFTVNGGADLGFALFGA